MQGIEHPMLHVASVQLCSQFERWRMRMRMEHQVPVRSTTPEFGIFQTRIIRDGTFSTVGSEFSTCTIATTILVAATARAIKSNNNRNFSLMSYLFDRSMVCTIIRIGARTRFGDNFLMRVKCMLRLINF